MSSFLCWGTNSPIPLVATHAEGEIPLRGYWRNAPIRRYPLCGAQAPPRNAPLPRGTAPPGTTKKAPNGVGAKVYPQLNGWS